MRANHSGYKSSTGARLVMLAARIGVWALAGCSQVHAGAAQDECTGPSEDCVAVGHWNFSLALGAGIRTNPLVNGPDIPLVVIPQFSYYGTRFFINNLDLGFTLSENATNTFSLVATPGYDRVYFYRTDLQNFFIGFPINANTPGVDNNTTPGAVKVPPPAPRFTYLAGPEWTFKYGRLSGQLDVLRDITGQNSGDEVRAALGMPLLESKGTVSANIGFTWKSAAIVNYYYGVPKLYDGGSALDPFIKLAYTLPLAGKWRFDAFAEIERLGSAIANSPIVAEHNVATVFVGATYAF
jgi:MipA family protein